MFPERTEKHLCSIRSRAFQAPSLLESEVGDLRYAAYSKRALQSDIFIFRL